MDRVLKIVLFACIAAVTCSYKVASDMSRYEPEIPPECRKLGYCGTVPNYPQDHVNTLIEKINKTSINHKFLPDGHIKIAHRDGPGDTTISACKAKKRMLVPEALQDKNNKWWIVLQSREKKLTQEFGVETCDAIDGGCDPLLSFKRRVETSKCNQIFRFKLVFAMELGNNNPVEKYLRVPSCCTCMLTLKP